MVGVQRPLQQGCCEEAGCYNPFQDFRECADEDDDPERGGRLVQGLPWLVKHHTIRTFQ